MLARLLVRRRGVAFALGVLLASAISIAVPRSAAAHAADASAGSTSPTSIAGGAPTADRATAVAPAPINNRLYKIKRGDTLIAISRRYGLSVDEIRRANGLKSDKIYAGRVLEIPTPGRAVWFYFQLPSSGDERPYLSLEANAGAIDRLLVPLAAIQSDGRLSVKPMPDRLRRILRQRELVWDLVVTNFTGSSYAKTAQSVLANRTRTNRAITEIVTLAERLGASGVQLDFENLAAADAQRYVAFAEKLGVALRKRVLRFTIAVPARTEALMATSWARAYDYRGLARASDGLMIMAYDQFVSSTGPGPIASEPWVREVLDYARSQVDGGQLALGLAAYGRDWVLGGGAESIAHAQALERAGLAGVDVGWDETASVPTFVYADSQGRTRQVYFENGRSWAAKLPLADEYGLAAVAVWKIGFEDPEGWTTLGAWRDGERVAADE